MASNPMESMGRQVAMAVVKGYNDWSIDSMMSYRAPNCIHQLVPASLSRPPMTNSAYRAYISGLLPHFRNFHVTINDVVEDTSANKVAIWSSCTAETELGPYKNEYMTMVYLNAKGKVEKIVEFVDTANSLAFFGRFRELMAEKGRKTLGIRL